MLGLECHLDVLPACQGKIGGCCTLLVADPRCKLQMAQGAEDGEALMSRASVGRHMHDVSLAAAEPLHGRRLLR